MLIDKVTTNLRKNRKILGRTQENLKKFWKSGPESKICPRTIENNSPWSTATPGAESAIYNCSAVCAQRGASAGFWLGGSMPPCRLRRRKFWKFVYEMVHSEVYLNTHVVSIAPFSTPACPDWSQNITWTYKTALFACYCFLIFHPFSRGSADPICPYVRTPMAVSAYSGHPQSEK